MKSSRILVAGSVAYDLLLNYDGSFTDAIDPRTLNTLSVGFVTRRCSKHHGGTAANIAWTLKLLNQDPLLIATVGGDGDEYLTFLERGGIATEYVGKIQSHMTATAIVGTDDLERQITFYHPGADSVGTWPNLDQKCKDVHYAIVSPRESTLMMAAVRFCTKQQIPFLFDPGQQVSAMSNDELLEGIRGANGLVANAYEWNMVSERLALTPKDLLEHTKMIIVTQGEKGLSLYTSDGRENIAACTPSVVINPTGAGDALRAGVLTGLVHRWSLSDAAKLGAAIASFVVEIEGTLLNSLDREALWARAEETYEEKLPSIK